MKSQNNWVNQSLIYHPALAAILIVTGFATQNASASFRLNSSVSSKANYDPQIRNSASDEAYVLGAFTLDVPSIDPVSTAYANIASPSGSVSVVGFKNTRYEDPARQDRLGIKFTGNVSGSMPNSTSLSASTVTGTATYNLGVKFYDDQLEASLKNNWGTIQDVFHFSGSANISNVQMGYWGLR